MSALKTKVALHRMAKMAISSLLPQDREVVERHITLLEGFPNDAEIRLKAKKLEDVGMGELFIIRASPTFLILFRYQDDSVEIMDIIPRERLQRMHELATT